MNFTPLFLESNFQMNGSNIRINELIKQAVAYGYSSLALTDERLYGTYKFYHACLKQNIKPILGLHLSIEGVQDQQTNRFLLYAKTNEGYKNLLKLASIASESTVTLSELKQYNQGLLAILRSDHSELAHAVETDQTNLIQEIKTMMTDYFEDSFVGLSTDRQRNKILGKEFKLVAIPHVAYLQHDDEDVYHVLRQIFNQSTDSMFEESIYHLLTPDELKQLYNEYPEAIQNVETIVSMCNVTLTSGETLLPSYPVVNEVSSKNYLEALSYAGLRKRLTQHGGDKNKYQKRLQYELDIIDSMGYNDYFLIVWDFVKYAKQQGYLVGPGRGSAAASLVSYCLGITSVDSIAFDLVFERFLNPERITLPDIDMDLPDDKRDDIITYVKNKYGEHRVSSICTFGTFLSKSALRDTARVTGVEGVLLDQLLKESTQYSSIKIMIEESKTIQNIMEKHPLAEETLRVAAKVEGLHRHVSTHAAGIILTDDDMTNHTAVQPGLLGMYQTQYEAKDLEQIGLLKIDFLGLRNLSSIDRIVDLIEQKEHKRIDVYKIPLDDEPTFELLRRVETTGLFQLESKGMRRLIGDMQIKEFDDIVTCLALFRPGPMENIPSYLKRRQKEEQVTYPHPILENVLAPTNGIIIYQEQIIQIASLFAGYSPGEADVLRRAVSKKQESVLKQERQHFLQKAKTIGRSDDVSDEIYDYIVKFANYGFNKAHSVAYAMVSYWMAYLKANYPKYFISVLTTSVIGSEASMREYIFEALKLGVGILPPSINHSTAIFEPSLDALRYPLLGIKHVGGNAVKAIIQERKSGPFESFVDVVRRLHPLLNKRVMEALIQAGAMDDFHHTKRTMLHQLENVINFTQFGSFIDQDEFVLPEEDEFSFIELQAMEQKTLGFNLFVNPLVVHQDYIDKHQLNVISDIDQSLLNKEFRLVGVLQSLREIQTKRNQPMAFVTISDAFQSMTGVLFTRIYAEHKHQLKQGEVYLLKVKLDERNNELQLIINNVHPL